MSIKHAGKVTATKSRKYSIFLQRHFKDYDAPSTGSVDNDGCIPSRTPTTRKPEMELNETRVAALMMVKTQSEAIGKHDAMVDPEEARREVSSHRFVFNPACRCGYH